MLALASGAPDSERSESWTQGEVAQWAEVLHSSGVLRRGAKKNLARYDSREPAVLSAEGILVQSFEPDALESLMLAWDGGYKALLEWWRSRLPANMLRRAQFPINVAMKHGPHALAETPKVIVGTIHSVKGGQADVVYLFPDLSQAGDAQYASGGALRDNVVRLFYVGITRARETLCICRRESTMAVSL